MPDKAFFDTNVLIYALAQPASPKPDDRTARAERLLIAGGVISVQVLNEFASVARRKLGMPWRDVKEALRSIRVLCPSPLPVTLALHALSLTLVDRYRYEIYDAMVLAAALKAKCTVFLSEDLQDGQIIEGQLTIRNPFL
jgi:predicted nucleic acid-binding protein